MQLLLLAQAHPGLLHLQKSLEFDPDQPDAEQIRLHLESYRATTSQPHTDSTESDDGD